DGVEQHALAEVIEARVRLIENNKMRVAKEGTRETKVLAKATGQIGRSAGDDRVVAVRQAHDHLVKAGQSGRFDDLLKIDGIQPRDDILDRLSEQIDVLRQVAEATAALFTHGLHVDIVELD